MKTLFPPPAYAVQNRSPIVFTLDGSCFPIRFVPLGSDMDANYFG